MTLQHKLQDRIGSDLPNYMFQFSLCAIYACYFSLNPPFY